MTVDDLATELHLALLLLAFATREEERSSAAASKNTMPMSRPDGSREPESGEAARRRSRRTAARGRASGASAQQGSPAIGGALKDP